MNCRNCLVTPITDERQYAESAESIVHMCLAFASTVHVQEEIFCIIMYP